MKNSLRFCMVTTFYPPYHSGGDAIFVCQLSNELSKRGHRVDVIHCIDSWRLFHKKQPTEVHENHPNVTVHGLKSPLGFLSPLATQQTGRPIFKTTRIRQVLEKGFDVIHYHNISLVGGPKILEFGNAVKLYTLHEYWLICPNHVLFRFNRAACRHPHCLACSLVHKRPPQLWRRQNFLKRCLRHVDAIISPSRFAEQRHRRANLDVPMVHLPNFVPETERPEPAPETHGNLLPSQPYFLFVGRLEKIKGPQTLVPVFKRFRRASLVIAGTGSLEKQLVKSAEGFKNIRFVGFLTEAQLEVLYRNAVAVIVPSINFEIFPLVVLEAFRGKTPVIAKNLGAVPQIVSEARAGLIYDTPEQLIHAMDRLLRDPSRRKVLASNGYRAYLANWSTKVHMKRYFRLIRDISKTSRKF